MQCVHLVQHGESNRTADEEAVVQNTILVNNKQATRLRSAQLRQDTVRFSCKNSQKILSTHTILHILIYRLEKTRSQKCGQEVVQNQIANGSLFIGGYTHI